MVVLSAKQDSQDVGTGTMGHTSARRVYVISDLHLGGAYPDPGKPGERGFRLCTQAGAIVEFLNSLGPQGAGDPPIELVINGDTVDFLAEREATAPHWSPFTADPVLAVHKLETIMERDRPVFDALHRFLERGHRLVVLLGNHDIELALPSVRRRFEELVDVQGHHDYRFIFDGEAYIVGDALIEHGNRYDEFNVVDNDALRRVRSLMSRRQEIPAEWAFDPPAGSKMVARVINPIKEEYRFIDLLKPEAEAVVPLLLALEPGYRKVIAQAAKLAIDSRRHTTEAPALPKRGGDIAAQDVPIRDNIGADMAAVTSPISPSASEEDQALEEVLTGVLQGDADEFLRAVEAEPTAPAGQTGADIAASDFIDRSLGFVTLLFARDNGRVERRLPALRQALRAAQGDDSFRTDVEDERYFKHVRALARHGIRHVVFGHTHKPKRIAIDGAGFYLNSGAWADVLRFPTEILTGTEHESLSKVREFVDLMRQGDFSRWTLFHPTYVQLEVDGNGRVGTADLCTYQVKAE